LHLRSLLLGVLRTLRVGRPALPPTRSTHCRLSCRVNHPKWDSKEDLPQLLMLTEPELGFRSRRSERLGDGVLRDHPGSLDGRVRDDAADCADADQCDSDCHSHPDRELRDAAAHGDPHPLGKAPWVWTCGYDLSIPRNRPVTPVTGGTKSFALRRAQPPHGRLHISWPSGPH
jgi:hypothetical protein